MPKLSLPLRAQPDDGRGALPFRDAVEHEWMPHEIEHLQRLHAIASGSEGEARTRAINELMVLHECKEFFGDDSHLATPEEERELPDFPEAEFRMKSNERQHEQTTLIPPEGVDTILRIPDKVRSRMRGDTDRDYANVSGEAYARSGDPWTSHAAARSIPYEQLRESQRAVLACFERNGPMHDERFLDAYRAQQREQGWPEQSDSGLRSRRDELVDARYMSDSGKTVTLQSGRASKVWAAA